MNVYVETNFVLELAFLQEQHASCERIASECEAGKATLVLPSFCIAESYEAVGHRVSRRTRTLKDLDLELRELSRSAPYKGEVGAFQEIAGLLARSSREEDERLTLVLHRILDVAVLVPLEAGIVADATQCRTMYPLGPQDSIVYCSVLRHLKLAGPAESCFISRNSRDFDDPSIEASLAERGCKLLFHFDDGYNYIRHRIGAGPAM